MVLRRCAVHHVPLRRPTAPRVPRPGTPKPPLISVEICEVRRAHMCCRRFLHPFLRNDPAAIPISAIHNELTDLCEVPGAKSQAAPFENAALQIPRPFEVGDTEGLEQEFARDVIERRASR